MKTTDEVRLVASVQSKGGEKNRVVIVSGKRLPYLPLVGTIQHSKQILA